MNDELKQAIETALQQCKNPYALAYLKAIPESEQTYGEKGLRTQLLYCLNNMTYWRGNTAKNIKGVFKRHIRELEKRL